MNEHSFINKAVFVLSSKKDLLQKNPDKKLFDSDMDLTFCLFRFRGIYQVVEKLEGVKLRQGKMKRKNAFSGSTQYFERILMLQQAQSFFNSLIDQKRLNQDKATTNDNRQNQYGTGDKRSTFLK